MPVIFVRKEFEGRLRTSPVLVENQVSDCSPEMDTSPAYVAGSYATKDSPWQVRKQAVGARQGRRLVSKQAAFPICLETASKQAGVAGPLNTLPVHLSFWAAPAHMCAVDFCTERL